METVAELRKLNQRVFNDALYVTDFIDVDGNPSFCRVGIVNSTHTAWINALTFNGKEISQVELDRVEAMLLDWYPRTKDYLDQNTKIKEMYKGVVGPDNE